MVWADGWSSFRRTTKAPLSSVVSVRQTNERRAVVRRRRLPDERRGCFRPSSPFDRRTKAGPSSVVAVRRTNDGLVFGGRPFPQTNDDGNDAIFRHRSSDERRRFRSSSSFSGRTTPFLVVVVLLPPPNPASSVVLLRRTNDEGKRCRSSPHSANE